MGWNNTVARALCCTILLSPFMARAHHVWLAPSDVNTGLCCGEAEAGPREGSPGTAPGPAVRPQHNED